MLASYVIASRVGSGTGALVAMIGSGAWPSVLGATASTGVVTYAAADLRSPQN